TSLPDAGPSTLARIGAIAAVLIGGVCGGLIGYSVTDLQCTDCGNWSAVGAAVGAIGAAIGVAVIVVLTLRAMAEWRAIEARGAATAERDEIDPPSDSG
ncbi:MAG: hypothetical protein IH940_02205, partial [Acidobacteria bacterium]|nr:hypothetical protein [Acidobacteriota bacterium]